MTHARLAIVAAATVVISHVHGQLSGLTVEYTRQPLGIPCADAPPRFGWIISTPAVIQTSYRVVVAATASKVTVWDSGVVASVRTSGIQYTGAALACDTDFAWNLTVTTCPTATPKCSSPATLQVSQEPFATALSFPADWSSASWIGGANQMRKAFVLPADAVVTRARAYVTGVGFAQLWLNGDVVSNIGFNGSGPRSALNPGFSTVFAARVLYNTFDVRSILVPGQNVVGLRIGMGKYGYLGEFCPQGPAACNAGIVRVSVDYVSQGTHTHVDVVSDGSWIGTQSEIVSDHLYNGEVVDGRIAQAQAGWSTPSFVPDASWKPVTPRPAPTAMLSSHVMPPVTDWATRSAVNATLLPDGSWVFDFGVNGAGMCELTLPPGTPPGTTVTVKYGELRNPDGSVYIQFPCPAPCCHDGGNCANQTHTYIAAGSDTPEVFAPTFNYGGFRYAQVYNWPNSVTSPQPTDFFCHIMSSGVASTGNVTFNTSAPPILSQLQAAIVRTQRANLFSHPTDCPHREKRGWAADAHVTADEASYNLDMLLVYENWLRTHADTAYTGCGPLYANNTCPSWQVDAAASSAVIAADGAPGGQPNCYICCYARTGFGCNYFQTNTSGSVSDVIPFDKNGYGSFPGSICWTSFSFVIAQVLLNRYNDVEGLQSLYPYLQYHMGFYDWAAQTYGTGNGLIWWETYGDWNAVQASSKLFLANCYYMFDALIMASIASALGKSEDAATYVAQAAAINAAVSAKYWNASIRAWDLGAQGANAVALGMGVGRALIANATALAGAYLAANVAAEGVHVTTGTIGTRWILQALDLVNRSDLSLALAAQTTQPSWGFMLVGDAPLGTLWEGWDGGSGSYMHIMFGGGPGVWFYEGAVGMRFRFACQQGSTQALDAPELSILGIDPIWVAEYGLEPAHLLHAASALQRMPEHRRGVPALAAIRKQVANVASVSQQQLCVDRSPVVDVLLQEHVVRSLRSSRAEFQSVAGPVAVEWQYEPLSVHIVASHASTSQVLIPLGLVSDVRISVHSDAASPVCEALLTRADGVVSAHSDSRCDITLARVLTGSRVAVASDSGSASHVRVTLAGGDRWTISAK